MNIPTLPHHGCTADEMVAALNALNFHPDASPYWDSAAGQEDLDVARRAQLKASNTNKERCALYREYFTRAMEA